MGWVGLAVLSVTFGGMAQRANGATGRRAEDSTPYQKQPPSLQFPFSCSSCFEPLSARAILLCKLFVALLTAWLNIAVAERRANRISILVKFALAGLMQIVFHFP